MGPFELCRSVTVRARKPSSTGRLPGSLEPRSDPRDSALAGFPYTLPELMPGQWILCLADLRPGDTLVVWKIDRLGRNLRDLIDIVTTLEERGVGVQSLTNGIVDTTTAHGKLVFGMFALMAEYEAGLIRERTQAGLAAARARGRKGGRKPKMTSDLIGKAQRMDDARQFTMAEIAQSCGVTPMTIYRNIQTTKTSPDRP